MANEKLNCNQICKWNDPSDGCIKPTYATCPMANTEPDASGWGQARANEKRLIDANALWCDVMMLPHNGDMISSEEVEQAIKDAPTVDAVEVVHGSWNIINFYSGDTAICSVCGWEMLVNEPGNGLHNVEDLHYCPNCGAKMGSDGRAAGGRRSDQSEWQRSADDEAALAARKMSGTATGLGGNEDV